jgi:hypothetical protein
MLGVFGDRYTSAGADALLHFSQRRSNVSHLRSESGLFIDTFDVLENSNWET